MTGKELRIKRYSLEISAQEAAETLGISSSTLLSIEDESKRVKDLVIWLGRLENYLAQCEIGAWQFKTWARIPADYFELMPAASKENISEMRELRLSLNIKSCVFARNLGWDESAISNYENHASRMPLLRWQKAMKLLQSELDKHTVPVQNPTPCKTLTPEEEAAITEPITNETLQDALNVFAQTAKTPATDDTPQQKTLPLDNEPQQPQLEEKTQGWLNIITKHNDDLCVLLKWLGKHAPKIAAKCPTREARQKYFEDWERFTDNYEVTQNAED